MYRKIRSYRSFGLLFLVGAILVSCGWFRKSTYNVPEGKHLLEKNDVVVEGNDALEYDISTVIRQQPNIKAPLLGRIRLRAYNAIDSAKAQKDHDDMLAKYRRQNKKRLQQDSIVNNRRIVKAESKFSKKLPKIQKINAKREKKAKKVNKRRQERLDRRNKRLLAKQAKYKDKKGHKKLKKRRPHKYIPYKPELIPLYPVYKPNQRLFFKIHDTVVVKQKLRERIKYNFGEAPVIADSAALRKSMEQMNAFLRAKGYYEGSVEAHFDTIFKTKKGQKTDVKKVIARYHAITRERFIIDSVFLYSSNPTVTLAFQKFLKKYEDAAGLSPQFQKAIFEKQSVSIPYDAFQLSNYRSEITTYMINEKLYGFTDQSVYFKVDTIQSRNSGPHCMKLTIGFSGRYVEDASGNIKEVPYTEAEIHGVYFHISDTTYFDSYADSLKLKRGQRLSDLRTTKYKYWPTLNTYVYDDMLRKVENHDDGTSKKTYFKSTVDRNLFGKYKDSIEVNPFRISTFEYNGELFVNPGLIECQNYLENDNYYKEYYIERSYTRMQQLGLFSEVDLEITEKVPGSGNLEVHYYLVPSTRQSFSFQPKATHVNGFLGISGALNYSSNNMFRTGTRVSFSIESGFEQNSRIVQDDSEKQPFFNTIEVGPALKFDIPGLFPFLRVTQMGKRQRPRTEISTAYNYQSRTDFERSLFQFNWLFNVSPGNGKTQQVKAGLFAPAIKFIDITKQPAFEQRINELNDQFLLNAYSNQLVWEGFRFVYSIDNLESENYGKTRVTFTGSFTEAGLMPQLVSGKNPQINDQGQRMLLGVPYSQFWLVDTKLITSIRFTRNTTLAYRLMVGYGQPGQNSKTSLPYDYSFSSGGANDVRGWEARQLGPGSYLSLLDPNAVATQIGDARLQTSLEYRFGTGGIFNHALFVDAGNTWTVQYDELRPGSQLKWGSFYKQLAIGAGYGLRLDFDFFIFRIDVGIPIFNPTLPSESRWVFGKHTTYNDLATTIYGDNYKKELDKFQVNPFRPHFHIGIGLPF